MLIRPGRPADATSVRRLVSDAELPTAGLDQAWTTLVAEDTHEVVGVAALKRHGPRRSHVSGSGAERGARRRSGLGAALVTAALAAADAEAGKTATVTLLTETANGYFDKFGFTRVERNTLPWVLSASPELTGGALPPRAPIYAAAFPPRLADAATKVERDQPAAVAPADRWTTAPESESTV